MARRQPRRLPLNITFLLARAGAEIGPHLLDGTYTPTLHRDIAQNQVSIEELLKPFAGKKTGLAFRVQEPNNDPNFGGEDCTIKWNDGTTWNDVPCDFNYPCYCQDVKGGGY